MSLHGTNTPREQSEHQAPREAGGNEAMSSPDGEPGRQSMLRSLRQLLRHRYFRRLLAVRVAVQSSDGVLQVALAAYVLFSPERQPDATSIAIVLAITLLPFSILGPFAAIVIDRVSRRQVLVVANLARAAVALGLAVLIATGLQTVGVEVLIYGGLVLAMSLNRFLLAALSASLPHTIDPHEYMVANSVVPTVGPAGLLIGVALATPLRLILGHVMTDYQANAILFLIATVGFVLSAVLALSIPRRQLGPDTVATRGCATWSPVSSRPSRICVRSAPPVSGCSPSPHIGSSTASSPSRQSCCTETTFTVPTRLIPRSPIWACSSSSRGPASFSRQLWHHR